MQDPISPYEEFAGQIHFLGYLRIPGGITGGGMVFREFVGIFYTDIRRARDDSEPKKTGRKPGFRFTNRCLLCVTYGYGDGGIQPHPTGPN
jgi:hypothetical protein